MSTLLIAGLAAGRDAATRNLARALELGKHLDDIVVLAADDAWRSTRLGARTVPISSEVDHDGSEHGGQPPLGLALRDMTRGEPSVALLLDADLGQVQRIGPVARKLDLPVLWWSEQQPSRELLFTARPSVDGVLTPMLGEAAMPGWQWTAGAGIDFEEIALLPTLPARPPLHLLALPRSFGPELDLVVRALAMARGLAVDAHLTVVLPETVGAAAERRVFEGRIRNLVLERSVHLAASDANMSALLAGSHVLVDLGERPDARTGEALLAMAHGRIVLSATEQVTRLCTTSTIPLDFSLFDERQLAARIVSLAAAWRDELTVIGQALRKRVQEDHSVNHWALVAAAVIRLAPMQQLLVQLGAAGSAPVSAAPDARSVSDASGTKPEGVPPELPHRGGGGDGDGAAEGSQGGDDE